MFNFIGVKNCLLYGEGIIDYQANLSDFWINHRVQRIAWRPKGIFIHTSKSITLQGLTIQNTPSWNQHPFYSKNINYFDITLNNPPNSPTTDGIDIESCNRVKVIGAKISVGDDCIAIKSGKIDFAKKYKTPSKNIIIRNCLMKKGHGGVTLGSENSAGINDVFVSNCYFKSTERGLRIKSQRGRGNLAIIKNIYFNNIYMDKVKSCFVINAFYKAGNDIDDYRFDQTYYPINDLTPSFNTFSFKNITCENVEYGLAFFLGLNESKIKQINLENITVSYLLTAKKGVMALTKEKEQFCKIGIYAKNVKKINIKNLTYLSYPKTKYITDGKVKITEE